MNNFLFYLLAFVVVLGVLVVIHELGHYLAARYCGVKVLRFSVGFGKPLLRRQWGVDRTEWLLCAIPLGGYVKMLDEREGQVASHELSRAFNRQTVGKRSLIVAAGPFANFILAIFLYWLVFMWGTNELLPVVGPAPAESPVAMAGIRNGDLVRGLDGEPVSTWDDLRWMLLKKAVDRDSVEMEVSDEHGEISTHRLFVGAIGEQGWEGDALERLGLVFYRPMIPPVIGKLVSGGPGEAAGLQVGDEILVVDDADIATWQDFVMRVRDSAGRTLHIELLRHQQVIAVNLIPEAISERGKTVGKIGVAVADSPEGQREIRTFVRYGVLHAARKAVGETWEKSVFSLVMMGKMVTGEVSWKNLSGPVSIADYAGQSARLGLDYYLKFMAMVSISLGVLNLLPIPVLDGGHLMYHIIEVVRRRPLSERAMEVAQQIGVSLLFSLMAFAFLNDINRLFSG